VGTARGGGGVKTLGGGVNRPRWRRCEYGGVNGVVDAHTPDTHTHDKNNTPNPQTNTPNKHLTTLEGGATTVRATSNARVDGRAEPVGVKVCRGRCAPVGFKGHVGFGCAWWFRLWWQSYMLNTRNEENDTVFYSYVACFVNTFTLNVYVSMSYTELTRRNMLFICLWLRHRNT